MEYISNTEKSKTDFLEQSVSDLKKLKDFLIYLNGDKIYVSGKEGWPLTYELTKEEAAPVRARIKAEVEAKIARIEESIRKAL